LKKLKIQNVMRAPVIALSSVQGVEEVFVQSIC
jgi:hypothetical protein